MHNLQNLFTGLSQTSFRKLLVNKKTPFFLFIGITFTLAFKSHAFIPVQRFTLSAQPKTFGLEVVAVPPPHHHFNIKAPMFLSSFSHKKLIPSHTTDRKIRFKIADSYTPEFRVHLFLCDDAKTYCEKQLVIANWDARTAQLKTRPDH